MSQVRREVIFSNNIYFKKLLMKNYYQVIRAFKKLHRTRQLIFGGDELALKAGRDEINNRFKQNMKETNVDNIKKV